MNNLDIAGALPLADVPNPSERLGVLFDFGYA